MELAPGAAAGGLAAFSFEEVKGARSQRPLGGHGAQKSFQRAVISPQLLAESGKVRRHLYSLII
jgi:hypothetical protein